mgnify:CR=1 FL=1
MASQTVAQENQTKAYRAALAADDTFQAAVVKQFGRKNAGDMRYQSKQHNTETKAAAEAFWIASNALVDANQAVHLEVL